MPVMLKFFVFSIFCIIISAVDVKTHRIPDWLILAAWFSVFLFDARQGTALWGERLGCACFVFAVFYLVYIFSSGGFGFGDVKLASFLGYMMGINGTIVFFGLVAIFSLAVYTAGKVVYRWNDAVKLPFAPFLCSAAVLAAWSRL
jgi:leader peptidase (prepilin peptidase)/N-methyltransferase